MSKNGKEIDGGIREEVKNLFSEIKEDLNNKYPFFKKEITAAFNSVNNIFKEAKTVKDAVVVRDYAEHLKNVITSMAEARNKEHLAGVKENQKIADEYAMSMVEAFNEAKEKTDSLNEMAYYLNNTLRKRTRRGKLFSITSVVRLKERLKKLDMI